MHSFRDLDRFFSSTSAPVGRLLSEIDVARGRQELFRKQNPASLKTLTEIALVQSVEASNAIENITAPHRRIKQLVAEKTTPQNRSEEEIAGYRSVLSTIHSSADAMPIRPGVIEQLHRDLYQFSAKPGGRWKMTPNEIEEILPDGTKRIRFEPIGVSETPGAMTELCDLFVAARNVNEYHPLLLTSAFVFDFLCIHPFSDGNGRMSRLLTLLLLYQAGIEVGRFISVERIIEQTKETYYESLQSSTIGWHEEEHDLDPWTRYFLGTLVAAYSEFEKRAGVLTIGHGAKGAMIKDFIRSRISPRFHINDVRDAVPTASDDYIRDVLRTLKKQGALQQNGRGKHATWERIHTRF